MVGQNGKSATLTAPNGIAQEDRRTTCNRNERGYRFVEENGRKEPGEFVPTLVAGSVCFKPELAFSDLTIGFWFCCSRVYLYVIGMNWVKILHADQLGDDAQDV